MPDDQHQPDVHSHFHPDHDCTDQIQRLEQQLQEHLDGWKRAKADYLNLKRQSEKEKMEISQFAQGAAVIEFLPVYDNLKRAFQHIPEEQRELEWVKGILHIQRQFDEALKALGITPMVTEGQPFDHTKHHAVSKVKQDGVASGTIVQELKTGFTIGDKVLEPAQVVVAE